MAGEFGLILRSDEAGGSWRVLHRGDASIFGLTLGGDGRGYAVGQVGTVLRTDDNRSEEHTSELQSLMRISYAGFCLKKKQTMKNRRENVTMKCTQTYKCINSDGQ